MSAETLPLPHHEPIHFITEKAALLKALTHCQGIVERRNTVQILAHVHIEAQGKKVKITATDLEIACIESLPAQVTLSGRATVSAVLLFDVVRKLPDGAEIEIKSSEDGSTLNLTSGPSIYNFSCLPASNFPFMTTENLSCTFKLHAAELAQLIDKTRFSMSTEETRYYLNGICFHATPDGLLRAIATDGLRLAQAQVDLPDEAKGMPQIIISRKTIHEIRKLLEEVAEEITLSLSENQVRFVVGSSVLISRLIEGKFPDYEKVIPVGNDRVIDVNVRAFAASVDRIAIMSTDKLRSVKMNVDNTSLKISAHSSQTGNALEELEVSYKGEPLDFGFNTRYILDVTQQIASGTLQFLVGDETQAIIVKDASDNSALYVLMPMRL